MTVIYPPFYFCVTVLKHITVCAVKHYDTFQHSFILNEQYQDRLVLLYYLTMYSFNSIYWSYLMRSLLQTIIRLNSLMYFSLQVLGKVKVIPV